MSVLADTVFGQRIIVIIVINVINYFFEIGAIETGSKCFI